MTMPTVQFLATLVADKEDAWKALAGVMKKTAHRCQTSILST
eukprot:CAMPEP_0197691040 /NCGR_PEP_ID=MMETSP1338-20131121/109178_1 /TAXON_ID=43686 ORGANISM="Pelagodinium beii, Strain RCC1491" /NCGR_SAMPLE_ID=MMETSP1338 /ASSEMBLY_ACC=CAM_ASM_000754 /LENGTH=41 /DNA_ID= /DNA_START= /DNA_END= /DNA_ORIENTATION=